MKLHHLFLISSLLVASVFAKATKTEIDQIIASTEKQGITCEERVDAIVTRIKAQKKSNRLLKIRIWREIFNEGADRNTRSGKSEEELAARKCARQIFRKLKNEKRIMKDNRKKAKKLLANSDVVCETGFTFNVFIGKCEADA